MEVNVHWSAKQQIEGLPDVILDRILIFLNFRDVTRLGFTSKLISKRCALLYWGQLKELTLPLHLADSIEDAQSLRCLLPKMGMLHTLRIYYSRMEHGHMSDLLTVVADLVSGLQEIIVLDDLMLAFRLETRYRCSDFALQNTLVTLSPFIRILQKNQKTIRSVVWRCAQCLESVFPSAFPWSSGFTARAINEYTPAVCDSSVSSRMHYPSQRCLNPQHLMNVLGFLPYANVEYLLNAELVELNLNVHCFPPLLRKLSLIYDSTSSPQFLSFLSTLPTHTPLQSLCLLGKHSGLTVECFEVIQTCVNLVEIEIALLSLKACEVDHAIDCLSGLLHLERLIVRSRRRQFSRALLRKLADFSRLRRLETFVPPVFGLDIPVELATMTSASLEHLTILLVPLQWETSWPAPCAIRRMLTPHCINLTTVEIRELA